jgi:uncharacterized oxidoreductase
MSTGMRVCPPGPLQAFAAAVIRAMGADDEIAAEVGRHLIRANLSGHDSHGIIRIPQYVLHADRGDLRPGSRPHLARETAVGGLVDANYGFGHFSTAFALEWAMRRAREHGLAAAAVRHSTHIGRLGEYTERAVDDGLIALVTVGAAGRGVGGIAPYGGRGRFLGTNPWSIGIPGRARAMMFDGATSVIAEGKVRMARAKRTALPPGCIIDRDGNPTQDPEEYYAGGALLPLGGDVAGHKGYGLALASALIGGLGMIDDPQPSLIGAAALPQEPDHGGRIAGVFLLVIDPATFGSADHYRGLVDDTLAAAKGMPAAPGRAEVFLPGEPEILSRLHRSVDGIAVPEATWKDLAALADRFRIPLPEHRVA